MRTGQPSPPRPSARLAGWSRAWWPRYRSGEMYLHRGDRLDARERITFASIDLSLPHWIADLPIQHRPGTSGRCCRFHAQFAEMRHLVLSHPERTTGGVAVCCATTSSLPWPSQATPTRIQFPGGRERFLDSTTHIFANGSLAHPKVMGVSDAPGGSAIRNPGDGTIAAPGAGTRPAT